VNHDGTGQTRDFFNSLLKRQISKAEIAVSDAEAAVRHWEAELTRKRQELKELRQQLDPKNLSGTT